MQTNTPVLNFSILTTCTFNAIQEFGIDIVGEDNKTIIHHKVAAKVVVVLSPEDLANVPVHHQPGNRRSMGAQLATQAVQNSALGGMGAGAPRQGKSGLTFDHLLSRLQSELLKSRETGSELTQLNGTMNDIQESLGGAIVRLVLLGFHVISGVC